MKNECMIVKDLLPLYIENLVSDETRVFVDEHLTACEDCRAALKQIRTSPEITSDAGAVPLKRIKKRLKQQRLKSVFLAVVLVMAFLIAGFGYLTAPRYVPYSKDLLSVSEEDNGTTIISFNEDKATSFDVNDVVPSDDGDNSILFIHAWKTTWDSLFSDGKVVHNMVLRSEDKNHIGAIFYSPNMHEEAVKIWGDDIDFHVIELPRLTLGYYLIIAVLAVFVGGVLMILFRKNLKIKTWIERVFLFPMAYIISHVITKGFTTTTYSFQRDLSFILLVTILIYIAGLFGISVYRNKKKIKMGLDTQ
jgi:ABC-type sugar transport system permease subunit